MIFHWNVQHTVQRVPICILINCKINIINYIPRYWLGTQCVQVWWSCRRRESARSLTHRRHFVHILCRYQFKSQALNRHNTLEARLSQWPSCLGRVLCYILAQSAVRATKIIFYVWETVLRRDLISAATPCAPKERLATRSHATPTYMVLG